MPELNNDHSPNKLNSRKKPKKFKAKSISISLSQDLRRDINQLNLPVSKICQQALKVAIKNELELRKGLTKKKEDDSDRYLKYKTHDSKTIIFQVEKDIDVTHHTLKGLSFKIEEPGSFGITMQAKVESGKGYWSKADYPVDIRKLNVGLVELSYISKVPLYEGRNKALIDLIIVPPNPTISSSA